MVDNLKAFLSTGHLKGSNLNVLLLKQIRPDSFIIIDSTMVAILDTSESKHHGENLRAGSWYKLIKCQKIDGDVISTSPKFKPVKLALKDKIDIKLTVIERMERNYLKRTHCEEYLIFEQCEKLPNHSKIARLVVKVVTMSRIIKSERGSYQICNIKDVDGKSTSINLYSKFINNLKPFQIFVLKNVRKGEVTKDDETQMRLHTTNFTVIENGTDVDVVKFEHIKNGQHQEIGEILGFGDILSYKSCKIHYSKLNEELLCLKCSKVVHDKDIVEDFKTEIYLEVQKEEETDEPDVREIIIFRRTIQNLSNEAKNGTFEDLIGEKAKVDYNQDDGSRLIAVSIELVVKNKE